MAHDYTKKKDTYSYIFLGNIPGGNTWRRKQCEKESKNFRLKQRYPCQLWLAVNAKKPGYISGKKRTFSLKSRDALEPSE